MTHRKIFYVTATLKIKVVQAAVEEQANLKSFKCVGIHWKYLLFGINAVVMLRF